jgi:hypothetical protein
MNTQTPTRDGAVLLTPADAPRLAKVSRDTIYREIDRGALRGRAARPPPTRSRTRAPGHHHRTRPRRAIERVDPVIPGTGENGDHREKAYLDRVRAESRDVMLALFEAADKPAPQARAEDGRADPNRDLRGLAGERARW